MVFSHHTNEEIETQGKDLAQFIQPISGKANIQT